MPFASTPSAGVPFSRSRVSAPMAPPSLSNGRWSEGASAVEDGEVELAQPVRVGEQVDLDDAGLGDREAGDGDRAAGRGDDESCRAVDERGSREARQPGGPDG